MESYDFKQHFNRLDHDKTYENIQNTPWYHDAVYEKFSDAEFLRRHALLRQAMSQRGFDCLIVPGGQSNWSQGAGMTWLTGLIDTRAMAQYVVFPREGEPLLVYGMGGSHAELMRRTVSACRVQVCSRGNYAEVMAEYVKSLGLERGRIGVLECIAGAIPEFPPQAQMIGLQTGLPEAKIEFVPGLIHALACLKSDEEVQAIGRAGALAVAALRAMVERAVPGATEHTLVAAATKVILACGGRVDFISVGSTPGDSPSLTEANPIPSARKLNSGDLILAEISAGFMGVTARIGNPICVGKPSPVVSGLSHVASEGFTRFESLLKPGTSLDEIRRAGNFFREHGCQCAPLLLHGLDIAASSPRVYVQCCEAESFEQRLQPGMIVVLRPNPVAPDGQWGIVVSRTYAITAQGNRCLTDFPLELINA